jgi:hypothetical protein
MFKTAIVCVSLFLVSQAPAQAQTPGPIEEHTTLFSDNFDADTTGTDKTTFATGWQLVEGTVSVFGPGFNDIFPGNGNYLELGTANFGTGYASISRTLTLEGGKYYEAWMQVAGDMVPGPGLDFTFIRLHFGDGFSAASLTSFDTFYQIVTLAPEQTGSYTLVLEGSGVLVDDLNVYAFNAPPIPEPAHSAMLLAGLAGLGLTARRRKGNVRMSDLTPRLTLRYAAF